MLKPRRAHGSNRDPSKRCRYVAASDLLSPVTWHRGLIPRCLAPRGAARRPPGRLPLGRAFRGVGGRAVMRRHLRAVRTRVLVDPDEFLNLSPFRHRELHPIRVPIR